MLKKLIDRVRGQKIAQKNTPQFSPNAKRATARRSQPFFEPLENRELLSTTLRVTAISADNRGEVVLTMNQAVRASTVTASSVIIYTPGPDGKIHTADDVRIHAAVSYDPSTFKITIHGRLDLTLTGDLGYRVRLISSKLLSAKGAELDGEFVKGQPSGNGVAGGDMNFRVLATTGNPTVRMSTSEGTILITLYKNQVAATVANFVKYANNAMYDNTIIHRDQPDFVIQGGGYSPNLDVNGLPTAIATLRPIDLQYKVLNTVGTIAMARDPSDNNSATSQFFFNLVDNSTTLAPNSTSGGYAAFGKVTNAAGLSVMNTIAALTTHDLTPGVPGTAFETVPEIGTAFVVIRRVAVVDTVGKL